MISHYRKIAMGIMMKNTYFFHAWHHIELQAQNYPAKAMFIGHMSAISKLAGIVPRFD